jgi:hypothetical protein
MRVGIIRTDLGPYGIYLSDLESRVQQNFSSHPPGQSRQVHYATDSILESLLINNAIVTVTGNNGAATFNTTANNVLRIRATSTDIFASVSVTAAVGTPKTTIRDDLNAGFAAQGLPFNARVSSSNILSIDSVPPNNRTGLPGGYIELDTDANGSTLNIAFDAAWAAAPPSVTGLSVAALRAATFPGPLAIDVSSATILALSTFSLLTAAQQAVLVDAIAEGIAPKIIETGNAVMSFAKGVLFKLRQPTFQVGSLPAGQAVVVLESDGVTPFVM